MPAAIPLRDKSIGNLMDRCEVPLGSPCIITNSRLLPDSGAVYPYLIGEVKSLDAGEANEKSNR